MRNRHLGWVVGSVILCLAAVAPAFAMSVEEAKTKGLVGEKANGYLGVVNPLPGSAITDERGEQEAPSGL